MSAALPRRRRLKPGLLDTIVLLAVLLAIWQGLFAYAGEVAITPPLQTVAYLLQLLGSASFWPNVAATMLAFLWSVVISSILGVGLGLVFGLHRFTGDVAEPICTAFYTIPKITLYPVMLLVFGLGMSAKVAFGVIHGLVPIILFTLAAIKNISPVLLRTSRVLRLTPAQTATRVLLPALAPEVLSGLRVGFSLSLLGVLIGEMFASQRGLGFLIISGINSHNVAMTTAVTLLLLLFALTANWLLLTLQGRIQHGLN